MDKLFILPDSAPYYMDSELDVMLHANMVADAQSVPQPHHINSIIAFEDEMGEVEATRRQRKDDFKGFTTFTEDQLLETIGSYLHSIGVVEFNINVEANDVSFHTDPTRLYNDGKVHIYSALVCITSPEANIDIMDQHWHDVFDLMAWMKQRENEYHTKRQDKNHNKDMVSDIIKGGEMVSIKATEYNVDTMLNLLYDAEALPGKHDGISFSKLGKMPFTIKKLYEANKEQFE